MRLVSENPFAWIVSGAGDDFRASLMPVRPWKTEGGRIVELASHFPRANDQVELLRADPRAHLLFLGPHAYVSSSMVRNRKWTPTWNFASAVVGVDIEFTEDPRELHGILEDLVDAMEAGREDAWHIHEMKERYAELSKRVIGFFARVRETRERYKLGQDEEEGNYADIQGWLEKQEENALLAWMDRFNPGKGA